MERSPIHDNGYKCRLGMSIAKPLPLCWVAGSNPVYGLDTFIFHLFFHGLLDPFWSGIICADNGSQNRSLDIHSLFLCWFQVCVGLAVRITVCFHAAVPADSVIQTTGAAWTTPRPAPTANLLALTGEGRAAR